MATKLRLNFMLTKDANSMLNAMVKEAKKIYGNGINRSRIIENLIIRSDPIVALKLKAKSLGIDLQATVEEIRTLESDQEKSKVSAPSYKKE